MDFNEHYDFMTEIEESKNTNDEKKCCEIKDNYQIDQFFRKNKESFDLIFLDGLHTYEQTIKDINNGIQSIQDNGIILIHDCLPKKIWNEGLYNRYSDMCFNMLGYHLGNITN